MKWLPARMYNAVAIIAVAATDHHKILKIQSQNGTAIEISGASKIAVTIVNCNPVANLPILIGIIRTCWLNI